MSAEPRFVFATVRPERRAWLLADLARAAPWLRLAYSRPGVATFKWGPGAPPLAGLGLAGWRLPSPLASAWGESLGVAHDAAAVAALAERAGLWPHARIHVFERELDTPVEAQDPVLRGQRARAVAETLRARGAGQVRAPGQPGPGPAEPPEPGAPVLDVVVPHGAGPDEPWLVGWHVHEPLRGPDPGGVEHVPLPPHAPSRAWCKLEESLRWLSAPIRAGERVLELGCAPGGMTMALLDRGAKVTGIDPGAMDPRVLAHPTGFRWLNKPAAEVARAELGGPYEWIVMDVNLAPMVALRYVERFCALDRGHLRGVLVTFKLNDAEIHAALDRLARRLGKLVAGPVALRQLPSHRSELVAFAAGRGVAPAGPAPASAP